MTSWIARFWDWVDNRYIFRRLILVYTMWLTYVSYEWAAHFAMTTTKTGAEVGLIVAAVTAPITALQGYSFRLYILGRYPANSLAPPQPPEDLK